MSISPSLAELAKAQGPSRTVTGVLTSRLMSRDIKIDSFSMGLNGIELIQVCNASCTLLYDQGSVSSCPSGVDTAQGGRLARKIFGLGPQLPRIDGMT